MSENKKLSIPHWSTEDRPREKLIEKGALTLSNAELIAILLGSGNNEESAVDLAKRILKHYNHSLSELLKTNISALKKFKGVGAAKAVSIIAALELARRISVAKGNEETIKITSPADAYNCIAPLVYGLPHEEFWVIYLSNANHIIAKHKIGQGGITATLVDIRVILQKALIENAVSFIICHNHPSGNLTPSNADKGLTQQLKQAAALLQINLLDHVIIAGDDYFSFADNDLL